MALLFSSGALKGPIPLLGVADRVNGRDRMGYWVIVDANTASGKSSDEVTIDAAGGRMNAADLGPSMMVNRDFTEVRVTVYAEAVEPLEAANIALPAVMEAFASVGEPMVFRGFTVQTETEWERINFPEGVPED